METIRSKTLADRVENLLSWERLAEKLSYLEQGHLSRLLN